MVDGLDGRSHHIRFPTSMRLAMVRRARLSNCAGRCPSVRRVALAVHSDLDIDRQVTASGATWLDRQAIARAPSSVIRQPVRRSAPGSGSQGRTSRETRALPSGVALGHRFTRRLIGALRARNCVGG